MLKIHFGASQHQLSLLQQHIQPIHSPKDYKSAVPRNDLVGVDCTSKNEFPALRGTFKNEFLQLVSKHTFRYKGLTPALGTQPIYWAINMPLYANICVREKPFPNLSAGTMVSKLCHHQRYNHISLGTWSSDFRQVLLQQ